MISLQRRLISEEEWHDVLTRAVQKFGRNEVAKRLGVPVGTITLWLRIPALRIHYETIRALPLLAQETLTVRRLLNLAPSPATQEKILDLLRVYVRYIYYVRQDIKYFDQETGSMKKHISAEATLRGYVLKETLERRREFVDKRMSMQMYEAVKLSGSKPYVKSDLTRIPSGNYMLYHVIYMSKHPPNEGSEIIPTDSIEEYHEIWDFFGQVSSDQTSGLYFYRWAFDYPIPESVFE